MAVYSRLLLSAGGGIISTQQQAEQTQNTASVLIGLGGTGVHCIRTIKTQVYSRLKPDNPNAVVPSYEHIRFLGIDTSRSSFGSVQNAVLQDGGEPDDMQPLDGTETFFIGNANIGAILKNPVALAQREDLQWLEHENIPIPSLADAGAGGIRQVGRFMMMDQSNSFLARIQQEINAAKSGLDTPQVNVHIFAGLSGGTGSGCFLDVCYMVRHIAQLVGGVTIFGYFFLPDVNLSNIPFANVNVRSFIPKNGYAAMQELEYCMNLQFNGGSFQQTYRGRQTIEWKAPPVDMCHLICATDQNNNVIPHAYEYAMNVTAEYVMDFLTHTNGQFTLKDHLANFQQLVAQANGNKNFGSNMSYCVLGASCASVPLREINTYLASSLFQEFSTVQSNAPTKGDVEELAITALAQNAQSLDAIYDALYREIQTDASDDYIPYECYWKDILGAGNKDLVRNYTDQTAQKKNHIESNAKSMGDGSNDSSLLMKLRATLARYMRDITKGPKYAYRLLSAAQENNFLNIIDGLLEQNKSRRNQEALQDDGRLQDYEGARADFESRKKRMLFDNDEKRLNDYQFYLCELEKHKLYMFTYEKLDEVLTRFRTQVEQATAAYYSKLDRVMDNLFDTFRENKNALDAAKAVDFEDTFAIPMMTIEDLKAPLDREIKKLNIPGMLELFVAHFVDSPEATEAWINEDENRISRFVTDFFVTNVFANFAGRTITEFLKDKYEQKMGPINDAQLAQLIYQDWMTRLTAKSTPLFYFDTSIWRASDTDTTAFLSFPAISAPIKTAATQVNTIDPKWKLKESALTDRIYVMCAACGLPLSSYNKCSEYEQDFFADNKQFGRHYYEGTRPAKGVRFSDWRQLPSLTPQSKIAPKQMQVLDLQNLVESCRALYREAYELGIINDESQICQPDDAACDNLKNVCAQCEKLLAQASSPADIPKLEAALQALQAADSISMAPTGYAMPNDGYRSTAQNIEMLRMDYFTSSPVLQLAAREIITGYKGIREQANAMAQKLAKKIKELQHESNAMTAYCDALFTGVLSWQGPIMKYTKVTFGIADDTVLTQMGKQLPFDKIPVYQGYVSFQALPDALKDEIAAIANGRYNSNAPELAETAARLRNDLSEERITSWAQRAQEYAQSREIMDFLVKIKGHFQNFCIDYGV